MGLPKEPNESLTICGGGTLNITAGSWEEVATGIAIDNASLTIDNCTLNISASYGAFGVGKILPLRIVVLK